MIFKYKDLLSKSTSFKKLSKQNIISGIYIPIMEECSAPFLLFSI